MNTILKIENLCKSFKEHKVLDNFCLEVYENEIVAIKGESGAGKSTLLNIIGFIERKDTGTITVFDKIDVKPFSRTAQKLLKEKVGYLFQNFALVDDETVHYNLALAMPKMKKEQKEAKIEEALESVGLKGFAKKKIYECSGGEQQRIAIARLLVKPCELILADEPTGSLDEENKAKVMKLLLKLREMGKTLIIVSHDNEVMNMADRIVNL